MEIQVFAKKSDRRIIAQLKPNQLETVNGSNLTMGCSNLLVKFGNITVCGRSNGTKHFVSYLSDEKPPKININEKNWASKLLTVKKSLKSDLHDFEHVLLTFGYEVPVIPDTVKLNLFLCPEWQIGAPYITLYGDNETDMVYRGFDSDIDFIMNYLPNVSSCDNLSEVMFTLQKQEPYYYNWHILVSFVPDPNIEWVHIGEVKFEGLEEHPRPRETHSLYGITPITGECSGSCTVLIIVMHVS